MPSALFSVGGSSAQVAQVVAFGSTTALAIVNTAGIDYAEWSIVGQSHAATAVTITPGSKGLTATITFPADPGNDWSVLLECKANGGRESNGTPDGALICRRVIGTAAYSALVPICSNEVYERDSTIGWVAPLNSAMDALAAVSVGVPPTFADYANFRAAGELANGTIFKIVSPPGEFRYSTTSGAGWADDGRTILKPTSVALGSNGRAFSTASGAVCPTFDALRGLKSGHQDHVHLQSHTTFGDGGGGIFDRVAVGSYVDDGGTVAVAGAYAYVRRERNPIRLEYFGAVGDNVADDAAAIGLAVAAAPAGSTITADSKKVFRVTHGVTVNKGLTFRDIHFHLPTTSTRVVVVPTITSSCDAILLVWNGGTRRLVDGLMQETAGTVDGVTVDNCTFEGGGGIGTSYLPRTSCIQLWCVKNVTIRNCHFLRTSSEVIVSDGYVAKVKVHDNWFIDGAHIGVSGTWQDTDIHDNHFIDMWGTSEISLYNAKVHHNQTRTTSGGNNGWWVIDGALGCKLRVDITDNSIEGDITYPILSNVTAGGLGSSAANFELVNICRNRIVGGANTGLGAHFIWTTSPDGGVLHVDDNYISDAGCSFAAGSGVFVEGTAVAKEITVNRLTVDRATARMYLAVQTDTSNTSPMAIDDLRVTGSGSFRAPIISEGRAYQNAVLIGSSDRSVQAIRRPVIAGREDFHDTGAATVLNIGDAKSLALNASAKTITQVIAAPGAVSVSNVGSATISLTHSAGLVLPYATDCKVYPGERATILSVSPAGTSIQLVSSDALDMVRKLWPLTAAPFAVFHADYRLVLSGSDVVTWDSIFGTLQLTVPGSGTSPNVGTSWTDGRATVNFNGTNDRISTAISTDFNGDDTPISIFCAFVNGTGTMVSVAQEGSSADVACRIWNNSTTETWALRAVGGTNLHATRTGMSTGPRVLAANLSSSGIMRITQGGTTSTTDVSSLGALSNQNRLTLGDIYSTGTSGQQYNGALRCVIVAKGLTDSQVNTVIQSLDATL